MYLKYVLLFLECSQSTWELRISFQKFLAYRAKIVVLKVNMTPVCIRLNLKDDHWVGAYLGLRHMVWDIHVCLQPISLCRIVHEAGIVY